MQRFSIFSALQALLVAALVLAIPATSFAERKSSLDEQPAVRKRKLLVNQRFELAPLFESSLNAEFRHTLSGGLKAEYHMSDMFSIGALGAYGASINTGLSKKIINTLPAMETEEGDPTPSQRQFEQHLNKMPFHAAAYASVTPWYGKLAAFGAFFVNFDFYFQGGVSFALLENTCCDFPTDANPGGGTNPDGSLIVPDNDPNDDPALNDGFKIGGYLAGGIHVFLNDFMALDLSFRDYIFNDNPSGLDFDADLAVKDNDNRLLNHIFVGAGVSIFFPSAVKRTP